MALQAALSNALLQVAESILLHVLLMQAGCCACTDSKSATPPTIQDENIQAALLSFVAASSGLTPGCTCPQVSNSFRKICTGCRMLAGSLCQTDLSHV